MDEYGLFTFMSQRDDAQSEGDEAGYNYWRGYIDAIADMEGVRETQLDEIEAAYQLMQVEAAQSFKDAVATGRARRRKDRGQREP